MKFQFFIIPVSNTKESQQELNNFCAQHKILSFNESFVADGTRSFWAISMSYVDSSSEQLSTNKTSSRKSVDYKEILSESDFTIYARLREIRKAKAAEHGVPSYVIFTNEQLATLVTSKVTTKAQMQAISGVGQSRTNKYGEPFLKVLNEIFADGK